MKQGKTVLGDTIILRKEQVLIVGENHFQTYSFPNNELAKEFYNRKCMHPKRGRKPNRVRECAVVYYNQLIIQL